MAWPINITVLLDSIRYLTSEHKYLRAFINMTFSGRSGEPLFSSPAFTNTAFSARRPKS